MPSSVKRERYSALEHRSPEKKPRLYYHPPSLSPINTHRVVLNPADCDLDFDIEGNGLQGSALYENGFAYCWSGARANVGITGGKYCFSCKVVSGQPVDMDDTPIGQKHLCRVGISRSDDKVGSLGETEHSFGFGGTGKFSSSGKFSTYGESFGIGDTILCAVDLESGPTGSIGFAKNGKWLGTVSCLVNGGPAVFPHVLLKNVVVQLQFGYEDGLVSLDGYRPWSCAFADGNGLMGPSISDERNPELIMMVGLPASGKTAWAERWVNDHPEKRYILLGTNLALDQMKIAVVVFSRPEDLKARSEKRFRETGMEVPAEAVNKMIANFVLPGSKDMPGTDEYFDQVVYIELNMTETKKCLDEMKAKLQSGISISPYSGQSDTTKLHYRTIPSGGHLQDRILSRDDLNHRRSYSGYEHRAVARVAISNYQRNSSNHTPTNETMDLSPQTLQTQITMLPL